MSQTFSTPVQANLDECGNYVEGQSREPVYDYVPITNASGRESGRLEWEASPEQDGRISTYLTRDVDVDGSPDGYLRLYVGCWAGDDMDIKIWGLPIPASDSDSAIVTLRIDDGVAISETWGPWVGDSAVTVHSNQDARLYQRLRGASSFTIEVADSGLGPVTFDLTGMFDTPVQENIDQCGMYNPHGHTREIEYDYVPIINVAGQSGGIHYYAQTGDDGLVSSSVRAPLHADDNSDLTTTLTVACWSGNSSALQIGHVPTVEGGSVQVTLRIDGAEPIMEVWNVWNGDDDDDADTTVFTSYSQFTNVQYHTASSVTVEIGATDPIVVTFDITGMFNTPVQENLDNCGMYKSGETRQPEQADVDPADQETTVSAGRNLGLGALDSVWLNESYPWVDGERLLALVVLCGPQGARVVLSGTLVDGLSGDEALVEWSLDDGPIQSDYWSITTRFGGTDKRLSPSDARATIAAWRNAAQLDMTITGAQPIVQRFDLAAMFSQALASSLDECLAIPLPTWTAPVDNVIQTQVGNLTYLAQPTLGSSWAYTFLWSEKPSDDAPDWAGYGSAVAVVCGIDGIGVGFYGLGLDREVSIEGDTVSVSYSADGGAKSTSTWDVWPWGEYYTISPTDDAAFYAAIKGADSLTITVASDPVFTETYDFAGNGFWETPVQPNLDACVGS